MNSSAKFSILFVLATCVAVGCQCGTDNNKNGDGTDGSIIIIDGGNLCGNGVKDPGEDCDDGNARNDDGCSSYCKKEPGYACPTPGQPCAFAPECGDSFIENGEQCDDGNTHDGDGCSGSCQLEPGWACPSEGEACVAAQCGDGIIAGAEACDTGPLVGAPDSGCSASCQLNGGWACDGGFCKTTLCGDGITEGLEQCDNGKHDWENGCSPACTLNPQCDTSGNCQSICGDGVLLPNEAADPTNCDDGNTRNGDGCSSNCKVEPDWQCTYEAADAGDTFVVPVVMRDFYSHALATAAGLSAGYWHPDFENWCCGNDLGVAGNLYDLYDDGGKPYLHGAHPSIADAGTYALWYRDSPYAITEVTTMTLNRDSTGAYVFDTTSFFPFDAVNAFNIGDSWVKQGRENLSGGHDFSLTSEVRYWFSYKGTEKLTFRGDDNVWVFINHKLVVDIGGVHGATPGSVDLSNATIASNLGLTIGGIYEVVVFQAERHTTESNYRLTLNSFEKKSSICVSLCGNGHLDPGEECDDGNRVSGDGCSSTCHAELN